MEKAYTNNESFEEITSLIKEFCENNDPKDESISGFITMILMFIFMQNKDFIDSLEDEDEIEQFKDVITTDKLQE